VRTGEHKNIEIWKLNRQVQTVPAGTLLRIQASSPFLLHWTGDEWQHSTDTRSQPTALDIDFLDIRVTQHPFDSLSLAGRKPLGRQGLRG
jgi:glucoamylase